MLPCFASFSSDCAEPPRGKKPLKFGPFDPSHTRHPEGNLSKVLKSCFIQQASMKPRSRDRGNRKETYLHPALQIASMRPRSRDRGNSLPHKDFNYQTPTRRPASDPCRKARAVAQQAQSTPRTVCTHCTFPLASGAREMLIAPLLAPYRVTNTGYSGISPSRYLARSRAWISNSRR